MKPQPHTVTVGSRRRITIPYNIWMDARCTNLKIETPTHMIVNYEPGVCMQKNMSYRVTLCSDAFNRSLTSGTKLDLYPIPSKHLIKIEYKH